MRSPHPLDALLSGITAAGILAYALIKIVEGLS